MYIFSNIIFTKRLNFQYYFLQRMMNGSMQKIGIHAYSHISQHIELHSCIINHSCGNHKNNNFIAFEAAHL